MENLRDFVIIRGTSRGRKEGVGAGGEGGMVDEGATEDRRIAPEGVHVEGNVQRPRKGRPKGWWSEGVAGDQWLKECDGGRNAGWG